MAEHVTVAEAAQRLGVSIDTIQRRMKRGDLLGVKDPTPQGFRWLVELPEAVAEPSDAPADPPAAEGQAPPLPEEMPSAVTSAETTAEIRRLEELVEAHRRQVEEQRTIFERQIAEQSEELSARRREVGELHVLIQGLQRALPAPPPDQGAAGATADRAPGQTPENRGKRRWWQRR